MASQPRSGFPSSEEIGRRLAIAGQRWTNGRRRVVEAISDASAPLSVSEIQHAVGPEVPLSTLYRIVSDLVDARVLVKLEFSEGFARFELDEELAAHHHHLVCQTCGSVVDLELDELERVVHATTRTIRQRSGFEVSSHFLQTRVFVER